MADYNYNRFHLYIKPVIENKIVKSTAPYIFSIITVAILIVFAIRPTISTILVLQKKVEDNRQVLDKLNKKAQALTEGKRNYESIGPEKLVKIRTAIPQNPEVTSLAYSLQNSSQVATSSSAFQIQPITIIDNTIPPNATRLKLGEITYSHNSQGEFVNLLKVLQNLHDSPRILNLLSVTIGKPLDGGLTLSTNGKGFHLKP